MTSQSWRKLRDSFPFALQTRIAYGEGASAGIGDEARAFGSRALVVTDAGVKAAGLVAPIVEALVAAGLRTTEFDEIEANPRAATIERGAAVARTHECDVIVAVGGGSSLDSAKAIAAVATHGGTVFDYEWDDSAGGDRVPGPVTPLLAVPTTSGTGSEVTLWAIVTDVSRNYKMPIGSMHLAPRVALVDPLLTASLPPGTTAATGVDALAHAIEGYTARCSNPISDALALYAIELISGNLERAVADGADPEARAGMSLGSLLAGIAFGNADTTAVHSMAEALGGLLDVGHGLSIAICLPFVEALNRSAVPERLARVGQAMGLRDAIGDAEEASAATVAGLHALMARLGIPRLADIGVTPDHVPSLVQIALRNTGNADNPVPVDEAVFTQLYTDALGAASGASDAPDRP